MSQAEPILGISRFSAQLGSNQLGSAGLATLSRAVATLVVFSQFGDLVEPQLFNPWPAIEISRRIIFLI